MKHTIIRTAFIIIMLLQLQAAAFSQCNLTPPAKVPLGANLNELTDYARDRVFNDAFKLSRPFSADVQHPFNFAAVATDANGWPLNDFGVVVMTEMDSTMGGTYRIQFKGQATIQPVSSSFTITGQVYNASNNTTTANLVYPAHIANGQNMFIGFTNTHFNATVKGVKNIKIMKPGLGFSAPTFSQKFLDHITRFDCLRFMDWHETNNNNDSLWGNRTQKEAPSQQTPNGVAWEYIIELANLLNKDVWINVPHRANDTYVTNLAKLFKNTLTPTLNVYVEYSNEVWNSSFGQSQWVQDKSFAEGSTPNSAINFDNVNDRFTWWSRYVAKRSKEISDKFKTVFGAAELNKRLRVVLPQQFGFFDFTVRGVDFINDFFGKPNKFFYAIAVAPYFATNALDATNNHATTTQILNELETQANNIYPVFNNAMNMWAARAAFYGLALVAYEGGPDTFGGNNINAKTQASRNAKMKAICAKYLANWYKYGFVSLFNWYSAGAAEYNTPFGTWALTENFENSQKLQAIDSTHNTLTPSIAAGQAVTADIDPRKFAGYNATQLNTTFFQPTNGFPAFYEYLVRVPAGKSGGYKITFKTNANAGNQSYKVAVDDSVLTTITPVNNNFGSFANAFANTALLAEGLHTIRITPVGGFNFRINNIIFTLTTPCSGLISSSLVAGEVSAHTIGAPVIFPNPSINKTAVLSYTIARDENVSMQLVDMSGRVLQNTNAGIQTAGRHQMPLQAQALASSIYFVKLTTGNASTTLKWLVK